ncbi:hypothetical protein N7481_002132 [Penicillium waksmanii]|uniref:uncharacterized protein n=1 Tax=Penicillium waksmanii TaxID=69791 RepID=UPI002547FBA1|nr:uncharacterized protein N7481_002132 [Penicillium waksmanii]KAJ5995155.1 hypothetical protein N7481_002132 [Penicillium waksmanii]
MQQISSKTQVQPGLNPPKIQPLQNTTRPSAPVKRGSSDRSGFANRPQPQSPRQRGKPRAGPPRISPRAPSGPAERRNLPATERNVPVTQNIATIIQRPRIPDSVIARRKEPPPHEVNCKVGQTINRAWEEYSANSPFLFKLMFHWPPEDGLTMKSCFGADLEDLDSLRKTWRVHIYIQHDLNNYLCVASDQSFDRKEMVQILHKVVISKSNGIHQPTLQKDPNNQLQPLQTERNKHKAAAPSVENLMSGVQAVNHNLIRSHLDRCLSLIKYVDAQVGVRVKFGTFIVSRWKTPGGSASYPLHKFPEMLRDEKWQGRLVPGLSLSQANLLRRCLQAQDTLLPMGTAKGIPNAGLSPDTMRTLHSASFEFARAEKSTTTFRLDVNFNQDHSAIESGSAQYRWFKTPTGATRLPPLQLAMIDFDRADWEIGLDFLEPLAKEDLSEAQIEFANNVKLDPFRGAAPISSQPRRRVMFSDTALISKLIQKTAIQFKVTGTDYVLEVGRFEESQYSLTGRTRWTPPSIQWGACVTSPRWNNLLNDKKKRLDKLGLGSLFPRVSDFHDFLKIVKKISEILGPMPQSGDSDEGNGDLAGVLDSELGTLF